MVMEQLVKSNQYMWNYVVLQEVGATEMVFHNELKLIFLFFLMYWIESKSNLWVNVNDTMIFGDPRH